MRQPATELHPVSSGNAHPQGTPLAADIVAYEFGPFRLDVATHKFLRDRQELPLTPKAFDTLLALIRHRHRVFSKEELLAIVWPNSFVTEDSLTQNVWALRRALGDDSSQPQYITTIPKVGYRFIADVAEIQSDLAVAAARAADVNASAPGGNAIDHGAVRSPSPYVGIVGVLVVLVATIAFIAGRRSGTSSPVTERTVPAVFSQGPPQGFVLLPGVALSADGRALAFVAQNINSRRSMLWLRDIGSGEVRPMQGTEGAEQPFWSPNSNAIGFFADGQLKTVDLVGTAPQVLATVGVLPQGAAWNQNDTILFAPWMSGLYSVAASGGSATAITDLDRSAAERSHRRPQVLPDGRHYLYSVLSPNDDHSGIYLATIGSDVRTKILDGAVNALEFVPPDRILGLRGTALVEARLDVMRARLRSAPRKLAGRVVPAGFQARAGFAASPAGLMAFGGGSNSERLLLFTRRGSLERSLEVRQSVNPVLSPNGAQILATGREGQSGVWLIDLGRDVSTRLVPDGSLPMWSPDGTSFAFTANRPESVGNIYLRRLNGHPDEHLLVHTPELKVVNDWSRDGKYIVFTTNSALTQDLWILPMFGDRKPVPYLQTGWSQIHAQVSPDGRWLAYASDESGRWEVYLQSFPVPGAKRIVSVGGGGEPKWRADGRELFYIRADKTLMAVDLPSGDPSKGVVEPRALFTVPVVGDTSNYRSRYTVHPKGDRFVFNALDETNQPPITVLVNWPALLSN
jgi:eukaryotic-like serine/threonine-protein kinase